jgi:murein DD-endopeptidase MepM/ murein hydrolase activator NlpD
MMKLLNCYFVLITKQSQSRVRQVRCTGLVGTIVCFFLLLSLAGLARIAGFCIAFTQAQIVYMVKRHEHETLVNKIASINKYFDKENQKLNDMVVFEDQTRLAIGLDPISTDIRKAGIGGHPSAAESVHESAPFPIILMAYAVQESLSILLRKAQLQNSTFDQMGDHVERLSAFWAQRPTIWPASGNVTSTFGYRLDPVYGTRVHHDGIDIANEIGTPVFAPADGIVKEAGLKQDFGKAVVLEHPETKLMSIYGHLSNFVVLPNQYVKRGDLIAFMGNSGKSTGPHLHYEVRVNSQPVNSARFILPTDHVVD